MLRTNALIATAAVVLFTVAAPPLLQAQEERAQATATSGPQRIEMVVNGLSCPFCAYGLEKKLRKVEGLDSLSVDFKTGQVVLLVQDAAKAGDERLKKLVKDAGFEVAEIKRSPITRASSESGEGT